MKRQREQLDERSEQYVVLDQQLALSAYLQALLSPEDVPEDAAAPAPSEAVPNISQHLAGLSPEQAAPVAVAAPLHSPLPVAPASANLIPEWATRNFQCLLFRVAGLTLALPLAKLNGVLPWDASAVTALPGRNPWSLGVRSYLGQQVRLIDVAKVIVPQAAPQPERDRGKVILIGSGRWGLVCDDLAEVVNLEPAAVKWRVSTANRPWLAGTVIDRMCALIDADAFAAMLEPEAAPVT